MESCPPKMLADHNDTGRAWPVIRFAEWPAYQAGMAEDPEEIP
jgi:hypothetical protein